jgi:hypothetical protein
MYFRGYWKPKLKPRVPVVPKIPELRRRTIPSRCSALTKSTGRKAYVIEIIPKKQKKYLMRGTIWLDAEDFAIVRVEGQPANNPSFWTKSVQFVHKYEKHGPFWLAESDTSLSDVRIFGSTELRIDYFDYLVNDAAGVQARLP